LSRVIISAKPPRSATEAMRFVAAEMASPDQLVADDVKHRARGEAEPERQERLGDLERGVRDQRRGRLDDARRCSDSGGEVAVVGGERRTSREALGMFWIPIATAIGAPRSEPPAANATPTASPSGM
jgi:hypothetical protein